MNESVIKQTVKRHMDKVTPTLHELNGAAEAMAESRAAQLAKNQMEGQQADIAPLPTASRPMTPFDPNSWYIHTHPLWFSALLEDRSEYAGQVPGLHLRFRGFIDTCLHGTGVHSGMLGNHIQKYWPLPDPADFSSPPSLADFARIARLIAAVEVYVCMAFHGNVDLRTDVAPARYSSTLSLLKKLATYESVKLALWGHLGPIIFRARAKSRESELHNLEVGVDISELKEVDLDAAFDSEDDE